MPEEDAWRLELVRGRVVRSPRPASLHGMLTARLAHLLYAFVEARNHGVVQADAGVVLARDPDTVRGPDISFFSLERIPENGYATPFWGPPDLAVEIASPSNRTASLTEKAREYLEAGVRVVWLVDPRARAITVIDTDGTRTLEQEDTLHGDDVLPGFRLPLARFFAL